MDFVDTQTGKWVFAILTAIGAAGVIWQICKNFAKFLKKVWSLGPRRYVFSKKRDWISLAFGCYRFDSTLLHWRLANSTTLIIHGFATILALQILLSFGNIGTLPYFRDATRITFLLIMFFNLYQFVENTFKYFFVLKAYRRIVDKKS